jgi:NAD(P)-dependent dehydrogenase (short-subunit alcohol dehydrogenase family)
MELFSLDGRRAVVVGGARGIGAAIAARFTEAGARVLVADVDGGVDVDVAVPDSVRRLAEHADTELGGIDVWVNSAGIYPVGDALELEPADWDTVLDVNLRGTFLGAREAARVMVAGGRRGAIVNIASTASYRAAGHGVAHYTASKFGVRGLTMSLAAELGPRGVRVLAIAPTVTDTPGLAAARPAFERAGIAVDDLGPRLPLGRVAVADDVARVAVFCASDLALFMTGSTILVDGGEIAI